MLKNRHLAGAVLMGGGFYWLWAAVPASIRPVIPANPMHKSEQTITVQVDSAAETQVPARAAGQITHACEPSLFLRPIEGPATTVRVLLQYQTSIVGDVVIKCPPKK